jgi:hypothetical protein
MMRRASITEDQLRGPDDLRARFTRQDRNQYLVISGAATAVLLIARLLQPSPNGVGTHTQIGLPPCAFLHFTGIPCLSCGLTTSVSHSARLHFYEALITQPFGLIVFFGAVLSIPFSLYLLRRRIPWSKLNGLRGWNFAMYALIALFLLSWFYKIAAMKGLFAPG